jgi:hypothetical protein
LALRHISGDGYCGTLDLANQAINLALRKLFGGAITFYDKVHGLLPKFEISIASSLHCLLP